MKLEVNDVNRAAVLIVVETLIDEHEYMQMIDAAEYENEWHTRYHSKPALQRWWSGPKHEFPTAKDFWSSWLPIPSFRYSETLQRLYRMQRALSKPEIMPKLLLEDDDIRLLI